MSMDVYLEELSGVAAFTAFNGTCESRLSGSGSTAEIVGGLFSLSCVEGDFLFSLSSSKGIFEAERFFETVGKGTITIG